MPDKVLNGPIVEKERDPPALVLLGRDQAVEAFVVHAWSTPSR